MEKKYRFVLYNIRYGTGSGWKFHTPYPYRGYMRKTGRLFHSITDFIGALEPDIVGLIEVDGGSRRSLGINQASQLADSLGHSYVFETKYTKPLFSKYLPIVRWQGNAFLARDRIVKQECRYFHQGIKRLFMEIELENCVIFLVHLSIRHRHRHEQLTDLGLLINGQEKPVIVAGDFNIFLGPRELNIFLESTHLKSANVNNIRTFPSRTPRMELDFILHSPEITIHSLDVPRINLSDHLPMVCDFSLKTWE